MVQPGPLEPEETTPGPSLARSTALMTAGTVISRATGVVRLAVLAAILGVTETRFTDTYNLANTAPNILYELVLGGVIASVFVPVFVELRQKRDHDAAWEQISAIFNTSLLVLAGLAVLGVLAAPVIARFYASRLAGGDLVDQQRALTFLLRLLIPQVVLYGVYFVGSGILNAHRRFVLPAWTPIWNNIVLIAVLLVFHQLYGLVTLDDVDTPELLLIGLGTTASVAPMGLLLLPALRRLGGKSKSRFTLRVEPELRRRLLHLSVYVVGFVAANQLGYIVIQWLANGRQGGYTAYISAFTFFLLPIGLFVVSLTTALMPSLSSHALARDWGAFRDSLSLGLRALLFLMVPSTVGLLVLAHPIVELLLQHGVVTGTSTALVVEVLTFFVLGLVQFSLYQMYVRAFYAMQDAKTPFLINGAVIALNTAINVPMYAWLGVKGLAAGHAVAYTLGVALQVRVLGRRAGDIDTRRVVRTALRLVVPAAGMALVAWGAREVLDGFAATGTAQAIVALVVAGATSAIAFIGLAMLTKVEEITLVKSLLLRRPGSA